jgi:hypothetical protein
MSTAHLMHLTAKELAERKQEADRVNAELRAELEEHLLGSPAVAGQHASADVTSQQ